MSYKCPNGNEFNTLDELAKFYEISPRNLKIKLNQGLTITEIVNNYGCVFDGYGRKFKNKKQFCNYYRITEEFYNQIVKDGLTAIQLSISLTYNQDKIKSLEQDEKIIKASLKEKESKHKCNTIYFEGNQYSSKQALCKKYNVKYCTFMNRQRRGWTIEECIYGRFTKIIDNKICYDNSFDYDGKHFKDNAEFCRYYKINYSMFIRHKNKGVSVEECLRHCEARYIVYDKKFKSINEICKYYNISRSTLNKYYYSNGKNINDAVTKAIKRKRHK